MLVIMCIATIGGAFADDCNILTDEKHVIPIDQHIKSLVDIYGTTQYKTVLPIEAFNKALINLKAYCCTQAFQKDCSSGDINNKPEHYPASAFLFDHLLDVAMRRLDGITWLAYNMDGDPKGVTPDPTGLDRRTKITEIANSANGTPANKIESLYTGYRTGHKYTDLGIVISGYNKNIATVSLGDKYDTICELVRDIYNKTTSGTIIWSITETNSFFNGCKNLVRERVKRETGYVKMLMVQKSNQVFTETMKAYTKKYFVEEKIMALWNLINKVKDIFKTIVQQAPVSKTCSQ